MTGRAGAGGQGPSLPRISPPRRFPPSSPSELSPPARSPALPACRSVNGVSLLGFRFQVQVLDIPSLGWAWTPTADQRADLPLTQYPRPRHGRGFPLSVQSSWTRTSSDQRLKGAPIMLPASRLERAQRRGVCPSPCSGLCVCRWSPSILAPVC